MYGRGVMGCMDAEAVQESGLLTSRSVFDEDERWGDDFSSSPWTDFCKEQMAARMSCLQIPLSKECVQAFRKFV